MPHKCIIVDDEPPAIRVLESHIAKTPSLVCAATFTDPVQALAYLGSNPVALAFLDIQMPHLTGLQLSRLIEGPAKIVFTTAYPDYALQGFDLNASDYLLKPISFERFCQAVNKLQLQSSSPAPAPEHLFVKTDGKNKYVKVLLSDIQYIEGLSNYVIIHCTQQKVTTYSTLKNLEESLPTGHFIRVHKSFIAAFAHISSTDNHSLVVNNREIPIGASYREAFFRAIEGRGI